MRIIKGGSGVRRGEGGGGSGKRSSLFGRRNFVLGGDGGVDARAAVEAGTETEHTPLLRGKWGVTSVQRLSM